MDLPPSVPLVGDKTCDIGRGGQGPSGSQITLQTIAIVGQDHHQARLVPLVGDKTCDISRVGRGPSGSQITIDRSIITIGRLIKNDRLLCDKTCCILELLRWTRFFGKPDHHEVLQTRLVPLVTLQVRGDKTISCTVSQKLIDKSCVKKPFPLKK